MNLSTTSMVRAITRRAPTAETRHRSARKPLPRTVALAAIALLALLARAVHGQTPQGNNDYYDPQHAALLRTVEQYHLYPGEERARTRQYEQAFNDFVFILRFFPNHPQALVQMVQLCSEWKSPKCYLDPMFETAIARRPDVSGTYVALGIYLHRNRKYAEAISAYNKALTLDPDSMNGHYNIALAYVATKDYKQANLHAQRAYDLGAPLAGLRDQLIKAGAWDTSVKPLPAALPENAADVKGTPSSPSK